MGKRVVNEEQLLNGVGKSRRKFVKKAIAGTAFVAPLVASFPMNGLAAGPRDVCQGNQGGDCDGPRGIIGAIIAAIIGFLSHLFGH